MAKAGVRRTERSGGSGRAAGNGAKAIANGANGAQTERRTRAEERELAQLEVALRKAAAGDFKARLPARSDDAMGRVQAAYNELAARNAALEAELVRVARIIGREGRMTERASLDGVEGSWSTTIGSLNGLIDDLVRPTTEVARVIVAVAEGDL